MRRFCPASLWAGRAFLRPRRFTQGLASDLRPGYVPKSPPAVVQWFGLGTSPLRARRMFATLILGRCAGDSMQSSVPLPLIQESVPANAIGNANESAPKPESSRKTSLPLKTLIVVRNEDTAFRLRVLFRSDPRFEVVSDCVSELEVLSVIERSDLDAMVIDLNLPQLGSKAFLGA